MATTRSLSHAGDVDMEHAVVMVVPQVWMKIMMPMVTDVSTVTCATPLLVVVQHGPLPKNPIQPVTEPYKPHINHTTWP